MEVKDEEQDMVDSLGVVFLAGCAGGPKTIWTTNPAIQTVSNQHYEIKLEPLTNEQYQYFDSFRLMVTNRTSKDLKIDWNETRYLQEGRGFGRFVWEGIDPKQVKESSIPHDIVHPGGNFSRVIYPTKKLAYAPLYREGGEISGGRIPEGENGIDLVLIQDGEKTRQRITVTISVKEVK